MKTKHYILISVGALALVIVSFCTYLYAGKTTDAKEKVIKSLDLPVAWIGFKPVLASRLFSRFNEATRYKGGNTALTLSEKQTIYNHLLADTALSNLANSLGLSISKEELTEEFNRLVIEQSKGDEAAFNKLLNDYYQLSPEDFKTQVLYYDLLKAKVASFYYGSNKFNSASLLNLSKIETRLKSGEDFESLAKSLSEDTASNKLGGDLGYIPEAQLLPEFRAALANTKPNSLVKTSSRFGLHLIFVRDITNSDNGKLYGLKQIFLTGKGFEQWESGQINNQKVLKLLSY